jgi:ABC-2 type transport system permease protein
MGEFAACFRKDLKRWLRDRAALAAWVGVPVFVGLLLALVFGRGEARPQGLLLVADLDQTFASRFVAQAFSQGELGRIFTVQKVALEEGERRIRRGDGSALLVIPEGFSGRFLRGEPQVLKLYTNPSQAILPGIARETVEILAEAGWYLQQALGDELKLMAGADAWPGDAAVAALSIRAGRLVREGRALLDAPPIQIEERSAAPQRTVNMAEAMAPGVVFMALLFLAFGLSGDLWEEKSAGALRRILASPVRMEWFLASKTLAAMVLIGTVSSLGLALGQWLAGGPMRGIAMAAIWASLCGGALFLLMALLQTVCRTERQGRTLANVAALLLLMAGGAMFPLEMMPAWMARIGRMTPNGWALQEMRLMLAGNDEAILSKIAAIVAFSVLLFAAVSARLKKGFAS